MQTKRSEAMAKKAAIVEAATAKEDAEVKAMEDEYEQEAAQSAAKDAAKRERKEAKREAKRQAKAAKEAEEKERAKYPVSKHSQHTQARLVACEAPELDEPAEHEPNTDDELLDLLPAKPLGAMPGSFSREKLTASSAAAREVSRSPPSVPIVTKSTAGVPDLWGQLQLQLKETFVSYLCASMPESLLRQYDHLELIGCLQLMLKEMRSCCRSKGLQDVDDEEPTALAEELKRGHGHEQAKDWISQLTGMGAASLRSKYDAAEVVDTLQSLSSTCFERLEEFGPVVAWAPEGSPLCLPRASPAKRSPSASPDVKRKGRSASPMPGRSGRSKSPAPLTAAGNNAVHKTSPQPLSGRPPPSRPNLATTAPAPRGGAAPQFSNSLGPPSWEQEAAPAAAPNTSYNDSLGPALWDKQDQPVHRPPPGTMRGTTGRGGRTAQR